IYIDDSRGNRFEHNRFRFSNFYIEPDIEILQKQSISTTNKVSGRPIYHYNGSDHDGTEVPIDAGQVIAGGVSNLSIKGLHIPKGTVGIEALECYDLMINDTFIDTQHYYGVLGRDCNSIIIYESHIYSELNGVDLCNCRDVEIKNCALRSGSLNIRIESGDDINILSSSFEDSDEGIWISGVGSAAVRDCELSNISNIGIRSNSNKAVISSCSFENMINGIELEAVAYNIIEKCQFTDSRKGVHLTQGSKMNRIEQSSFNSCNTSIGLRGSEENIIENNSMAGTKKDNTIEGAFGISAYYSGSNQIISNDIFDLDNGLYLFASERTMIINNSFVDSDIRILGIGVHHYTGHTITLDNTINNRKIYYLDSINASDLSFEDEPGQIIAVNVHDLNIRGVGHSGNGGQDEHDNWTCHIALAYSHDIRIEQCTFENGMIGIEIITSRSITISENLFKNLDRGIWGRDSSNLVLSDNRFGSGIIEGIYLFLCSGSMVTDSTFHGLETGLRIFGSWNNSVIGSFFTENGKDILIGQNSMENTVRGNMFLGTENASITLEIDTDRNVIIDNAFLSLEDPKIGPDNETLFMECSGFSNRIEKNYWSTGPGSAELDQEYLDQPMNISGYAGSRDPYPLTNIPRSILSAPWKLSVEMLNLTHLRITWNASKLIGITEDIEYVLTVINESSKEVLERIIVNDQNETLYVEIEYDRSDIVVHVQAQILNHTSYPNSTIFPIPNEGPRIFTDLDIDGRTINWTEIDVTWTVSSNFTDEFMHFYSIDGEHWIEIEDPHFILSGVHEGDFTFRISSMDLLGNMNEKRFEFYWDNTAPTFNITSPVEGSLLPGEFSVNWTFDQEDPDIDHMEWTLDGDRWIEEYDQAEGKTFALSTGEHHLTLTAYDIALNRFSRSMDLLIDADPPEFVIEKIPRSTDPLIFEILIMFSEDVSIDDTVIYMVGDPGRITWDNARTAHYLPSLEMEYEMMYHIFVSTIDLAGNKMEGEDSFYFILPPEGYGVLHAVIKGKGLNENIRGIMYLDGSIHNDTIYPGNIHIDDLLPGTYIITFEFNGYEQYIIDVEIVAGHETDLGTIELVPIGDPEVKDHSTFIMIGVVSMAVIAILCLLIIKKGRDGTYEE
ncbi:MAG: NosD domain-containing protein, partial [Candidatus Thermoplasmatota archaeon]|nr:NosD domain-containing protein [Candidatus Thermoplasmatota archaeon]